MTNIRHCFLTGSQQRSSTLCYHKTLLTVVEKIWQRFKGQNLYWAPAFGYVFQSHKVLNMCVVSNFFSHCFYMNLPAFGFSAPRLTAPRAHLCQSLILESLLPEKNEKQKLKSERGRWSFLTSSSKFGLVAYSWKSLLHRLIWVIQGRERKCVRRDPACDATRQEFRCGHAIEVPARWCERCETSEFSKGGLCRFIGSANGGGCIVKLGMNAVLPAI